MSTDPYKQYASPYLAMGNTPINGVDPDGGHTEDWYQNDETGKVTWFFGSSEHDGFTHVASDEEGNTNP